MVSPSSVAATPTSASTRGSPAATTLPKITSSRTSTTGRDSVSARARSDAACWSISSSCSGPPPTSTRGAGIARSRAALACTSPVPGRSGRNSTRTATAPRSVATSALPPGDHGVVTAATPGSVRIPAAAVSTSRRSCGSVTGRPSITATISSPLGASRWRSRCTCADSLPGAVPTSEPRRPNSSGAAAKPAVRTSSQTANTVRRRRTHAAARRRTIGPSRASAPLVRGRSRR